MFVPIGFFAPTGGQVVTDGLEQWIDPLVSSTADQSGNGRNVTLNGGLTTSGGNYILDANGKYISNGWSQTLNSTWTWCAWMKIGPGNAAIGPVYVNIISNYQTSTTPFAQMGFNGYNESNNGQMSIRAMRTTTNNEANRVFVTNDDMRNDTWYYYCWGHNASTGQYWGWRNGVLEVNATDAAETGDYTSGQNLVTYGGHSGRTFGDAEGGPFQIYNRVLSDDEVLQNYNADKGRYGL